MFDSTLFPIGRAYFSTYLLRIIIVFSYYIFICIFFNVSPVMVALFSYNLCD